MKKLSLLILFIFFFNMSVYALGEYNGDWHKVDQTSDKCDFIGNAKLNINFKTIKIKAKKWKWIDSNEFSEKFFKGKFRKNYTDIYLQSRGIGYKHILEGMVYGDNIFLTFSSSHTAINAKYGGCKFEFVKD